MSSRKRLAILVGVLLILIAGGAFWHFYTSKVATQTNSGLPKAVLKINGISLVVEVAQTKAEHEKGLSGRTSLSPDSGMLFIFPEPGIYGFWMPDMHFAIDILWLDSNLRVVYIKKNATPDSYPTVFTPDTNAKFVLEVVSGFTDQHSIKVGDTAVFTFASE